MVLLIVRSQVVRLNSNLLLDLLLWARFSVGFRVCIGWGGGGGRGLLGKGVSISVWGSGSEVEL